MKGLVWHRVKGCKGILYFICGTVLDARRRLLVSRAK
jgi:hypothetical protein